MSLTLEAFALKVCYYLGYYEGKVKELEAKIAILEEQNKMLASTECLYVENCSVEGCKNWWIDGDDNDRILKNKKFRFCYGCFESVCEDHAIAHEWNTVIETHMGISSEYHYCSKCKYDMK